MKKLILALSFFSGCGLAHAASERHEVWRSTTIAGNQASVFLGSGAIVIGGISVNIPAAISGATISFCNAIETAGGAGGSVYNSKKFNIDVTTQTTQAKSFMPVIFSSAVSVSKCNLAEVTIFWDFLVAPPAGREIIGRY